MVDEKHWRKTIVSWLFLLLLFFFSSIHSYAQDYAYVRKITGLNPVFYFNTLNRYFNGITLDSWTKLRLELNESTAGHSKWELSVMASAATIESDGLAPDLDLASVQIIAAIDGVPVNTVIDNNNSPLVLSNNAGPNGYGDILLSGTGVSNIIIDITLTYDCGTEIGYEMIGKQEDFYYVELIFRLYSIP